MKEKKTGMATNSVVLAFVRCFTYASSFIQAMVMSRVFSKYEYGSYSQACLIVAFISPFLLLGLSNTANFFYNQKDDNKREYVSTIFNLVLLLGIIGGLCTILLHNPIAAYFSNISLIPLIYIIAFRPLFQNLIALFQVLYIATGKTLVIAVRNTAVAIIQIIIVFVAAIWANNIKLILILLVLTDFAQAVIFHTYFAKNVFSIRVLYIKKSVLRPILRYALPLALSTMVGTLSINMDTMMIGRLMPTETFALYSNMAKELPFYFIVSSFTDVVFPVIISLRAKRNTEKLKKYYKLYLELGLTITWILVGGAIVCAKELILILYSEKYVEGIWVFVVYLFVSSLRFTYYGMLLSASGRSRDIFKYSVISLICNFILNIVLYYALGIVGPAVATFVTVLITGLLQLKAGAKSVNLKLMDLIDAKYMLKIVVELCSVGVILFFAKKNVAFVSATFRFIVFYCLFVLIVFFINRVRIVGNMKLLNRG